MVELALARLLRRSGELTGSQLPREPVKTRGLVKITQPLPPALETLLLSKIKPGSDPYGGKYTAALLSVPDQFKWEAEQSAFG